MRTPIFSHPEPLTSHEPVKARLARGQRFNAYQSGDGYVVGIGPVTDVYVLVVTSDRSTARLLEAALRAYARQPEARSDVATIGGDA